MCNDPNHHNEDHHEMIHDILDLTQELSEDMAKVRSALYGEGTTKGLITKVDDLTSGRKVETGVVSTITSIIVAVLTSLGITFGGGKS